MFLLLCLSLLVSKKNVSPMEIPRDFPGVLSRKKMGQKRRFPRCLPHENFWKLTGMPTNQKNFCLYRE